MRSVREWASSWSFAEVLGPEPPLWLGGVLVTPAAMGVVALGAWNERNIGIVVALCAAAVAVAKLAGDWLIIEPGRALTVIAIHLAIALAVTGGAPSTVVAASVPLAIAALPVLLKLWGMFGFTVDVAVTLRRHRAKVRAWLANPDDRGIQVQCSGMQGGDIVARVQRPGTPREVVIARRVLPGRGDAVLGRELILFDPVIVTEPRATSYRDAVGERVERARAVGWMSGTDDAGGAEIALSALVVVATHAGLVALGYAIGEVTL